MGNDAPIVSWDAPRGLWVYRASAMGGCETAMIAARQGLTQVAPPAEMQKRFDDGHRLEAGVIELFEGVGAGWELVPETAYEPGQVDLYSFGEVVDGQLRVEVPVGTGAVIRGHLDGIVKPMRMNEFRVLEGKALAESTFREAMNGALRDGKGLWEKYRVQLSALMIGAGALVGLPFLPAVFVAARKIDGELDGQLHYEYVDAPLVSALQLKARVARIEAAAFSGEGELVCKRTDYPCPFFFIHEVKEDETVIVEDAKLEALLELREEVKRQGRIAVDESKIIGEQIAEALDTHGRKVRGAKTRVGAFLVTWVEADQPAKTVKAYTSQYALIKRVDE